MHHLWIKSFLKKGGTNIKTARLTRPYSIHKIYNKGMINSYNLDHTQSVKIIEKAVIIPWSEISVANTLLFLLDHPKIQNGIAHRTFFLFLHTKDLSQLENISLTEEAAPKTHQKEKTKDVIQLVSQQRLSGLRALKGFEIKSFQGFFYEQG